MPRYDVTFHDSGTTYSTQCQSVKLGNRYLHLKDETQSDDGVTVAMVPFDSVVYIALESVTISEMHGPGDAADVEPIDVQDIANLSGFADVQDVADLQDVADVQPE